MMTRARTPSGASRRRLILRISQAHTAPGMSLARWQEITSRRGLPQTADAGAWDAVSDAGVRAIAGEIAEVVRGAK